MSEDKESALSELAEASKVFQDALEENKRRYNEKWNSLSKEDQLDYFCAVVERIHEGDVVQKRSYRGVLYGVFGFGPEAYVHAQCAGYLSIHNMIYDSNEMQDILKKFAVLHCGQVDNYDLQDKINEFAWNRYA